MNISNHRETEFERKTSEGSGVKQQSSTFSAASGEDYELQMGRWSRLLAGKLIDFVGLEDHGKVLDAGCGTGALSTEVLKRTKDLMISAVDISPIYIEHAKSNIHDQRLTFEIGDLTSLPFGESEFDRVFSQLVLHFIPQSEKALVELFRITKPGGTLAATVWDTRGGLLFNRIFLDTAAMIDVSASELRKRIFTRPLTRPGELAAAFKNTGWENVRSRDLTIRTEFESFNDYWAPFDGEDGPIPEYLSTVDADLRLRIKEAVRQAYLDGEADGPRSYTATALAVTGKKQP